MDEGLEEPCLNTRLGTCPICQEPLMDCDIYIFSRHHNGLMLHLNCWENYCYGIN